MNVCLIRMFVVLLGLGSTRAESHNSCTCTEPVTPVFVAAGETVSVPCPAVAANDLTFHLLRDEEEIASHHHNPTSNSTTHTNVSQGVGMYINGTAISFKLTGLTKHSLGLYSCKAVTLFPPPLWTIHNASRVHVLMAGQCVEPGSPGKPAATVWILCVTALALYGLLVTLVAFISLVKCKRAVSSQGDYINAPRRHNKCGGVMIPVARYF